MKITLTESKDTMTNTTHNEEEAILKKYEDRVTGMTRRMVIGSNPKDTDAKAFARLVRKGTLVRTSGGGKNTRYRLATIEKAERERIHRELEEAAAKNRAYLISASGRIAEMAGRLDSQRLYMLCDRISRALQYF